MKFDIKPELFENGFPFGTTIEHYINCQENFLLFKIIPDQLRIQELAKKKKVEYEEKQEVDEKTKSGNDFAFYLVKFQILIFAYYFQNQ